MKKLGKIFLLITIIFSSFSVLNISYAVLESGNNIEITNNGAEGDDKRENYVDKIGKNDENFFQSNIGGDKGTYNTLIFIAKSLKDLFFLLSTIYLFVIVIKVLFSENTEEEIQKFKKGIIWITVGIVIMQSAFAYTKNLYGIKIDEKMADNFNTNIVDPIIGTIAVLASLIFIAIAIFSFYRMVTANGDEEKIKSGKTSIIHAIIGFVVITLSRHIVSGVYGKLNCSGTTIEIGLKPSCIEAADVKGIAGTVMQVINWMNGFIGLVVVIMIIYVGSQILLSNGDEEKIKKAKSSIMYIIIGLVILAFNYLLLTFFIIPETTI